MFFTLMKTLHLGIIGGALYLLVELIWRGHTHWTMGVLGGICFTLFGFLTLIKIPLYLKALAGTLLVTFLELCAGLILNIWLKLSIWDYSALPFNLYGQICVPYALLWLPLSIAGIILYPRLHSWLFQKNHSNLRIN
ncbi:MULTISPECIES: hypothetical protein [Bacillaceae]|uniref:putative ABC transporter permease n=1 Tax=Bacillaceae TaxID=186817 RepID=UPI00080AF211|nr:MULTISPECIES: hypothetical protein [Bacillaceae]OCA90170.1 hypothetical protein A8L44_04420 [Bacillus sp. FJAT-27986]